MHKIIHNAMHRFIASQLCLSVFGAFPASQEESRKNKIVILDPMGLRTERNCFKSQKGALLAHHHLNKVSVQ